MNGSVGAKNLPHLDCFDFFKNGSCLISSNLSNESNSHNEFAMPFVQQLIWSFIFGLIVFISTAGNLIICWIILFHKQMRSITNFHLVHTCKMIPASCHPDENCLTRTFWLLVRLQLPRNVNLSVADIMVSTLNVLFNFTYMLNTDWRFGKIYCKISNFIAILSVSASVWSLFAISINRYLAIIYPLKKRISKMCTINITLSIWLFSSILSLPNIISSKTEEEKLKNGHSKTICYLVWPDGVSSESNLEYIYNIVILLTTYCIPISGMIHVYTRIGIVLWSSKSIGEYCSNKQLESIKSKRKIVKMMIFIVIFFAIAWLPYHVYFLLAHHYPEILNAPYVQHIYLAIYALAMSHSMSNPLILCWMNGRFRSHFKSVFCCLYLRNKSAKQVQRHHRYKQRTRCTERLTNQTQIRFISTRAVTLIDKNGKTLEENHSKPQEMRTPRESLSPLTNLNNNNLENGIAENVHLTTIVQMCPQVVTTTVS